MSHILHSAKVVVNEEGTEASAATGALLVPLMGLDPIIADKPFIFLIKDSLSNAILFAGRVSDPDHAPDPLEEKIEAPAVQEVFTGLETNIQKIQRPGPPAPLGPRKPGRPNGFNSAPSINFENGDDQDLQPAKPTRSVTTTTPPPFIRVKPTKETEQEQPATNTTQPQFIQVKPTKETTQEPQRTSTTPPPFIRVKTTPPTLIQSNPKEPKNPHTTTDSSEYEDDESTVAIWRRSYFPGFRVLWYRYYGIDQSKTKRTNERFVFSS